VATFKHIKFGDGLTVVDEGAGVITVNGAGGPPGPTGPAGAAGPGVPAGGTTGQVLQKTSGTDYATGWTTPSNDIPVSIVDVKGDLIAATANDTVARLPAGANGQLLAADNTQTTGLRWTAPPLTVSYGTTLPASPVDGQEAILVDSTTNPTWQWRFRYNAGSSSAYKWEWVGGSPWISDVATGETTTSTTPAALTTPQFLNTPRAGDYLVRVSAQASLTVAAFNVFVGVGVTASYYTQVGVSSPAANYSVHLAREARLNGRIAGETLAFVVSVDSGTGTFRNRSLAIFPSRVS